MYSLHTITGDVGNIIDAYVRQNGSVQNMYLHIAENIVSTS